MEDSRVEAKRNNKHVSKLVFVCQDKMSQSGDGWGRERRSEHAARSGDAALVLSIIGERPAGTDASDGN